MDAHFHNTKQRGWAYTGNLVDMHMCTDTCTSSGKFWDQMRGGGDMHIEPQNCGNRYGTHEETG